MTWSYLEVLTNHSFWHNKLMLQNNIFDMGANVAIDVTDDVKTL